MVLGSADHERHGRVLMGSVAARLFAGAPCAVAIAPRGYGGAEHADLPRVIGVGFDGRA